MTTCPMCGAECYVRSSNEGTNSYIPLESDNYETLRTIISCRADESLIEAAKRWRKTMEWYADRNNWVAPVDPEHIRESILNAEFAVDDDLGQRARACLGDTK